MSRPAGCLAVLLLPFAALLLGFSCMVTTEAESPEDFPGLRDNTGDVALFGLRFSVVATVLALFLVRRARRRFVVPVVVLCVLLTAGFRLPRVHPQAPARLCGPHGGGPSDGRLLSLLRPLTTATTAPMPRPLSR